MVSERTLDFFSDILNGVFDVVKCTYANLKVPMVVLDHISMPIVVLPCKYSQDLNILLSLISVIVVLCF